MDDNWQDNPKLAGIDKNKLDMLQQMAGKEPENPPLICCHLL